MGYRMDVLKTTLISLYISIISLGTDVLSMSIAIVKEQSDSWGA